MGWRLIFAAASLLAAVALGAAVWAQLAGTQTASGTVTVSSTSASLYICEPNSTPVPDCGPDDSDADEAVFETLENIRPGGTVEWDIRLKNAGTEDWLVTGVTLGIAEVSDPGGDCPDDALQSAPHPSGRYATSPAGVFILGKAGDDLNDNPSGLPGVLQFARESNPYSYLGPHIKVAAGDYEDVRLRLELLSFVSPSPTPWGPTPTPVSTASCDGNEWNVSWQFTVS